MSGILQLHKLCYTYEIVLSSFNRNLGSNKNLNFEDGVPVASTMFLADGYYTAAELFIACSIVQGPAPNFMAQWVFDYITHGLHQSLGIDDIKYELPKRVAEKVQPLYLGLNTVTLIAIDKEKKC